MKSHSARYQVYIITLLTLLLIATASFVQLDIVTAQDLNRIWSAPLFLGDGWWQSITVDGHGTAHIGWYGVRSNALTSFDVLEYSARLIDGTWFNNHDVITTFEGSGLTVRNSLAVTGDGMLHAAYRHETTHRYAHAPAAQAYNAQLWSQPLQLGGGYYVDLAADRNDYLHFVSSGRVDGISLFTGINAESGQCVLCSDLFYRRSTDGGHSWSQPFPISLEPNSGNDRLDIFEGQSGRLYIIWDEGSDWYIGRGTAQDVRIVYSQDSGLTWSKPIILDGGGFLDRRPIQIAAAELRDGSLMAVWRYHTDVDRNIYYQITQDLGVSWTEPAPIPGLVARGINDTPLDDYELVTDKLGIVHLFATGQPNEQSKANASLYHAQYSQGVWQAPIRVFYSPEMRPEWPKAAVGLNNELHLTWFIRGIRENLQGEQSATDILKVYYSHLPGQLQSVPTLAFRPTQTPLPTPTLFRYVDPTITPFPTVERIETPVATVSTDIYASQTFLGGLIAAGIVCGLAAIFVKWLRRG